MSKQQGLEMVDSCELYASNANSLSYRVVPFDENNGSIICLTPDTNIDCCCE